MNEKMDEQLDLRSSVAGLIGAAKSKYLIFKIHEDPKPSEVERHRKIMLCENVLWMYRIYSVMSE